MYKVGLIWVLWIHGLVGKLYPLSCFINCQHWANLILIISSLLILSSPKSFWVLGNPRYHVVLSVNILVAQVFVRGSGKKRAYKAGNNASRGQSATMALCLMEKYELCHCYFPSLAAWPVTADRKFPRKGTKFSLYVRFLGTPPHLPCQGVQVHHRLCMCSFHLGPVTFWRELQSLLMPFRLNSGQQIFIEVTALGPVHSHWRLPTGQTESEVWSRPLRRGGLFSSFKFCQVEGIQLFDCWLCPFPAPRIPQGQIILHWSVSDSS